MSSLQVTIRSLDADEGDRIYKATGLVVDRWNQAEAWLGMVFSICATPHNPRVGLRINWSSTNFRTKLDMARVGIPDRLATLPNLQQEWRRIDGRLDKLAARRNNVAHGVGVTVQIEG